MVDKTAKLVFNPMLVYAVVILNERYGNTGMGDLGEVVEVGKILMKTFHNLGIPAKNITVLKDATYDEVEDCWDDLKEKYKAVAREIDPSTLFITWYSGRGEMGGSGCTEISLNSKDPDKKNYPLEWKLNMLAQTKNTFTLGFFDCGRI